MTPTLTPWLADRIEARMAEWTRDGRYGGLEWLIRDAEGETLLRGRSGRREIGGPEMPGRPIWRIYSMTKPIVSIAAMQLVEECRLHLHAPISRHLPEYERMDVLTPDGGRRPAQRPITVAHLLTHMSGLFYGFPGEPLAEQIGAAGILRGAAPLRDEVRRLAEFPLEFEPGTGWRYSFATDVLAAILEVIEERPIGDILRDRVLGPLGMAETGFFVPEPDRPRIMGMHMGRDEAGVAKTIDVDRSYPADDPAYGRGGHGLFSTTDDYARFSGALLRLARGEAPIPGLVGPNTLAHMTADHVPDALKPLTIELLDTTRHPGLGGYGFGMGFRRALGPRGRSILAVEGEFGWSGAAETWFSVDPASGVHALFMAQNLDWPGASEDFQTLLTAALN